MTLIVAAQSPRGLALSADTLALTRENGKWVRLPPMIKIFEIGHTMVGAAVEGVRNPTKFFMDFPQIVDPADPPGKIAALLVARCTSAGARASFLLVGYEEDQPRIFRASGRSAVDLCSDGYVCVGQLDESGSLPRGIEDLDALATFTRGIVKREADRVRAAGMDPPLVAEPILTCVVQRDGWSPWKPDVLPPFRSDSQSGQPSGKPRA